MMASSANNAPFTNSTSGNVQGIVSGQKDVSIKNTTKSAGTAKMADRTRRESPVDQTRRAPPPPKAWTSGTNPIVQRGPTSAQPNGSSLQSRTSSNSKATARKEVGLSDKHSHDRLRFILGGAIGLQAVLTTRAGDRFEGILAGLNMTTNSNKFTLKMTKKITGTTGSHTNGITSREAAFTGSSPEYAMTFDVKDLADLNLPDFSLPEAKKSANGSTTSFQTDTDISANASRGAGMPKELQKWVPDGPDDTEVSLESGSAKGWDQFEAHRKRFGDKSTYHEDIYTTSINRTAPDFEERSARASRLEREIQGEQSTNVHVREERGQTMENDHDDEEDKYSGVRRQDRTFPLPIGNPNKYTPPARRAPSGQPTVQGAAVDPAIMFAQLSRADGVKAPIPKTSMKHTDATSVEEGTNQLLPTLEKSSLNEQIEDESSTKPAAVTMPQVEQVGESAPKQRAINTSISPRPKPNADNPTEDVEAQVLDRFRQFAKSEKERIAEKKRVQATQDRTAKLNDLLRFSKTFRLNTPIPTDLVGILAKDPKKQEAIIEKAQKEHEEARSTTTVPSNSTAPVVASASAKTPTLPKFDASQIPPPIPDRALNRGRGGYQQHTTRSERLTQQMNLSGRTAANFSQRPGVQQDRKGQVLAPIPLPDGRTPPSGPSTEQASQSPQRSNMHTPTSATSRGLTSLSAKASEFRPNVNAPTFNPSASSNTPSSPASVQRTSSISRAASPTAFFGSQGPKAASDRISFLSNFNPIKRMRKENETRKSAEKPVEPVKDYAFNGYIPNAYHTGPVWTVKTENQDKTYDTIVDRIGPAVSPMQSRSGSSQHIHYQGQIGASANSGSGVPQITTPQHGNSGGQHLYGQPYDDHRMHVQGASPQVYPSPSMVAGRMSNFASPMVNPAQLAYQQPQFYGGPAGQMSMPMRHYPGNPGMMHGQAPMMVQQQSSGPYMAVPQQYGQMQMYSPSPGHVYPQQNGFPSPGRMAPIMVHQGSQQGHPANQQIMYGMPGQGGPMMYGQQQGQMNLMRGGYGAHQGHYGSSPHQPPPMQQRAMSSGYGQKVMSLSMSQGQGPPSNAPQQPAAFSQMDITTEDVK